MSERRSVWLATADIPPKPALSGDHSAEVVIVGGGITGLTTAYLLQRAGVDTLVLEARRIGVGTTGGTTGKVTSQHGLTYVDLVDRHGHERAQAYGEANQAAIDFVESTVSEHGIECGFTRAPSYVYDRDGQQATALQREADAARRLGLPAMATAETDLPFEVAAAVRFDDQAMFHAGQYLAGLTRAVEGAGGRIFEGSRATDVEESDDGVTITTSGGRVRAGSAVLATLLPFLDRGGFFAKATAQRAYGIAARLRSGGLTGMHISASSPTRSTRPWTPPGGGTGIVVVGEDHPTGADDATPGRWGELERWANEHFDVASFEYRWSAQDYLPADGLPYVGRSPRSQSTFVATGMRKWGLTNGTAAAHVLSALVQGQDHPWAQAFDATRIGDAATVKKLVEDNAKVGARFVKDWVGRLSASDVGSLAPGQGAIVKVDGHAVAAYRRPDGTVEACSATCTHLGCTVRWNGAEETWDCPCHGSRFATDGEVLEGPATSALDAVEAEAD